MVEELTMMYDRTVCCNYLLRASVDRQLAVAYCVIEVEMAKFNSQ